MVVCAWCKSVLREEKGPISHGICAACAKEVKQEIQQMPKMANSQEGEKKVL